MSILLLGGPALAQRAPTTAPVDPELEKMAEHNLTIADYYFNKKKAYKGARDRLLEIVDTYPGYTKVDRVYFLLGQISVEMDDPDKAREYLERLLSERPESELAPKAKKLLAELGPAPAPAETKTN